MRANGAARVKCDRREAAQPKLVEMVAIKSFALCLLLAFTARSRAPALSARLRSRARASGSSEYLIGAGRTDITGPAAQVNMMGYAVLSQKSHGIHFRLWSRAFIISDAAVDDKKSRVVFVNIDTGASPQILKIRVMEELRALYGNLYTNENVLISSQHTHSGPGGYFQYYLFDFTSLGFVEASLVALVNGVVKSIRMAHENLKEGRLFVNSGELLDASINRSPTAYMLNPESERLKYEYDTDKEMTVLKMVDKHGVDIGMIDWFAVHCTSMNNTNQLISGDNKGSASILMEQAINGEDALTGKGPFIAAFATTNEGDVSPNTNGAICIDTGLPCDSLHSSCDGKSDKCIASGPGEDMFESTKIIGEKQFLLGNKLYDEASTIVSGHVGYKHRFVDLSNVELTIDGEMVHTCPPAMGYSFAAGTTDGPGDASFVQGTLESNPLLDLPTALLFPSPSDEQIQCQSPKPILLNTGACSDGIKGGICWPFYPWQPTINPLQILTIGQLVIVAVPAEFTTMAGRRTREIVKMTLEQNGYGSDLVVVIAGLSNTYSDYVTTFEEYQQQRYEAASTIYGPHTLDAYLSEFKTLAEALALDKPVDPGPDPPNFLDEQVSFLPPVITDLIPFWKDFGDVIKDAKHYYSPGQTVEVTFYSGNPRNDLMTDDTFLTVEMKVGSGQWKVVRNDAALDTRFFWSDKTLWSEARITWDIGPEVSPGVYRIRHFGHYKPLFGSAKSYNGASREFVVTTP